MFKRNLLPFFVCFSFCPNGESKSVLIAQTHGQKVILYLPSVVPSSFVYLLLNCLRRIKKEKKKTPKHSVMAQPPAPGALKNSGTNSWAAAPWSLSGCS